MITFPEAQRAFSSIPTPSDTLKDEFLRAALLGGNAFSQGAVVNGVFFVTIAEAVAAATANQTIFVGPGVYTTLDNLNGIESTVSIRVSKGAFFDGTTGDDTRAIWDTSTIATPAAGYTGAITGEGFYSKPTSGAFTGIFFGANVNDSGVFEGFSFDGQGNTPIWVDGGRLIVRFNQGRSQGGVTIFTGAPTADVTAYISEIDETTALPIWANSGKITVYANRITTTSGVFLQADTGGELNIYADDFIQGLDSPAIHGITAKDAGTVINCYVKKVSTFISNAAILFSETGAIINAFQGIYKNAAVNTIGSGIINESEINVFGSQIICESLSPCIGHGVATVLGNYVDTAIINNGNNVASTGINADAGVTILDDVKIVVNTGAFSINAPGVGRTVKVYRGVANKLVNAANVTEQVNNLTIDALVQ